MANITVELSDDMHAEISEIASQLGSTPQQFVGLALTHFTQAPALESSIEAMERLNDNETLMDFPELREELELDIKFHPMAMDELDSLTEEEQVVVLEDLINRISGETTDSNEIDLVIKETPEYQIVLSEFSFGQVVYKIGESIVVYYVGILEDDSEEIENSEEE